LSFYRRRAKPAPGDSVLIIGLGNPGGEYTGTRHNVGFLVLDEMADRVNITFRDVGHCSLASNGSLYGQRLCLAKPMTYMNRSGGVVRRLLKEYRLGPEDLLVVHDDLDIEFGKVRLKRSGGDAGQRGIRSIIEALNTRHFSRIRVGIGRGEERGDEADYVLSPFTADEREKLGEVVGLAVDRIYDLIRVWDRDRIQRKSEGEDIT
jgi:PTH1 family peptidyl-tRNA hydrolase